jgi:hypothetical protein
MTTHDEALDAAARLLVSDPSGVIRALEAQVRARAVADFTRAIDGLKAEVLTLRATLAEETESLEYANRVIADRDARDTR